MKKLIIILIAFCSIKGFAQNKTIDSLKYLVATAKEDTNKIWLLQALSSNYVWSFADTAILYAQQGLQLAQKLRFKPGEAWCMDNLSTAFSTLGSYSLGSHWGFNSLSLFKTLNDTMGMSFALGGLSLCNREMGDYKKALYYVFESGGLRNYEWTDGLISSIYERMNKLDSALFYVERANKEEPNNSGMLYVFGAIHSKLNHDSLALNLYKAAIPFAKKDNALKDVLDCLNGISNVYLKEGKSDSAVFYAKEAINQQWARAYPLGVLNASQLLAKIYESQSRTDSTLKYLTLTISLKDSLFNQQKTREAESFAFNEQLHQQELQQKLEQNELMNKNRQNMIILAAVLIVILIVTIGLWRKNVYKQKSYELLQKQNQEIDTQKARVERTLDELKTTQAQLIQSEKMASLGELTAGIAHEIQNPLNFVNNFSEVNKELIEELKSQKSKLKSEEQDEILNDIDVNLEKILHHGKRADAIVKGMLQHSRKSTGQKEPTDINTLCDEYLRLSYHGMRAQDNSFNAEIKTDFDKSIGKINVVPQDIGRVLLNLFNNAFYTVSEKLTAHRSPLTDNYKPTVSVQTKKVNNEVEIIVSDNGNGIPKNILDKIFQPFFTTKPTGEGTGLGLSLSYDIVKAHGGEIRVETKEARPDDPVGRGEGSEFVIQLPAG